MAGLHSTWALLTTVRRFLGVHDDCRSGRAHRTGRGDADAGRFPADRRNRRRHRVAFRHRHLPGARRAHSDRARPPGGCRSPSGQCGDRSPPARHHRAGSLGRRAGAPARARGLAAACPDRRSVRRHRRGPDRPGLGCGEHDPRPRSRPLLLDAHARDDRTIADRGQRLCDRSCRDHPRRDSGHGLRRRPRQAPVRPEPRSIPPVSDDAGQRARAVRRHHHQTRRLDRGARRRHHGKAGRAAVAGTAQSHHRNGAAGRAHSAGRSRRRRRKAARLRRHVSVRRANARPARRGAIDCDAREHQRVRQSRSTPARHSNRLRADVRGDRAHRAALLGLDRAGFCQQACGPDPPPDRRRQRGLHRQPATFRCRCTAPKATSRISARPSTT